MNDYQSNRYAERQDFLSIAFFDLWLANDDRHPGHYNLFVTGNGDLHFVAFDHEQIFNGGNLDKGLYELSQEASILSSPLLFKLFSKKELGDRAFYEPLFQNWYLCTQSCKARLAAILEEVPHEWRINIGQQDEYLKRIVFSEEWFERCKKAFFEIIQINLNRR